MEYTLFETPKVHAFKLPPKKSAAGYKAEEWQGHNIWLGQCKIVSTDDEKCYIRLMDDAGKLFAECPLGIDPNGPKSVENVTDSSRYFILRVVDRASGQHAFLGIGFDERSEAFDFSVAITDFKTSVKQAKERANKPQYVAKECDAVAFKAGEKITVQLGGKVKTGEKVNATVGSGLAKPSGGLLAPPPGKTGGLAPPPGRSVPAPPVVPPAPTYAPPQQAGLTKASLPDDLWGPAPAFPSEFFDQRARSPSQPSQRWDNFSGNAFEASHPSPPSAPQTDPFGGAPAPAGNNFGFGPPSSGFGAQSVTPAAAIPVQKSAPVATSMDDLFKF